MRRRRLVRSEESSDEMEAATLNQASAAAAAEEVQWNWKREALQTTKTNIVLYSRRVIVEQIADELKLIGDGVYQEFLNSCFGFLMRFDMQGQCCRAALHCLFAHEVVKADAAPDELWYRVGSHFIRFSKYEYALVTGLSFGPTTFDPSREHHPPASGLFLRHYGGQNLTMDALLSDFNEEVFRESPADALKVAKLLIVYFLLFGMNGNRTYIDKWVWTLIEDSDGWETFIWGKYSYQILLSYLQWVPTELPPSGSPSYRLHGYVWAFLIWAFEAIPKLGNACGVRTSNDVLPRCLRWGFSKMNRVDMDGFCDRQMEVQSTLEPSAEEKRQPYWEHIHDDLQSGVCYIHQDNPSKRKKTTPVNLSSHDVLLSVSRAPWSKAIPIERFCSMSTNPMKFKKKRKRTDPLSTRASPRVADQEKAPDLSDHESGRRDEMTSIIRQEFFSPRIEVHSTLEPSAEEQRQPYWKHNHDDLQSGVCYINQDNRFKMKTTTCANPSSRPQGSKTTTTRRYCFESARPIKLKKKRKRADPLTTRASLRVSDQEKVPDLSDHECGRRGELTSVIRQDFFSRRDSLSPRHTPDDLPVGGASSSIRIARPRVQSKCLRSPATVLKRHKEDNMNSEPEFSDVAVGQAGRNKSIFELMEKINELKNKNMENERLLGVHEEKCKCLDIKMMKMGLEIEELRQEKLEADQVVKELKHGRLKANKTIDELRLEKLESDKLAGLYKSKLEKLSPRIKKIEEHLANMFIMKVDLAGLVNDARKLATSEDVGDLDFPDDAEYLDSPPPGLRLTFNSSGLSKKGDRNLAESCWTREGDDAHNTFETSSGSQSGCNPPQPKSNERKEPQSGSGAHASGTRCMSDKISAENLKMPNDKNNLISELKEKINELRDINLENERLVGLYQEKYKCLDIKIVKMGQEIDDETLASTKAVEELRCKTIEANKTIDELRRKNIEAYKTIDELRLKISESDKVAVMLTTKVGDFANLVNDVGELATSDVENVVIKSPGSKNSALSKKDAHASGTQLMSGEGCFSKIACSPSAAAGDITEMLDSDDESLSDSRLNDFIASLGRKWMDEADLLQAFQHDEELCMNAICSLYRQQAQLKGHATDGGFSPVDSMSGSAVAEYLIDGDRELRLTKSLLEVKKERPNVIGQCRKLATANVEKLFQIYCTDEDPFFGQS